MAITGPGDHYIAPERRCEPCGALLGPREQSPCEKCAQPKAHKPRGATKATLAYRAKMFGTCPDCGMLKSICFTVGGCQPAQVQR